MCRVTEAGVDTWSPCWYVAPDGPAARWLGEQATVPSKRGAWLVAEPVGGHRLGWFPAGLVFAEGHPDPAGGLCPANELVPRALELQEAIQAAGLPLSGRERGFTSLGAASEGLSGLRRADFTVNVEMAGPAGLATLAAIAGLMRDAPGVKNVIYGAQRRVETVYLRGHSGRAVLGRWYDKATESLVGPPGSLVRGEDQRRWPKGYRRDVEELTPTEVKRSFQRRFYPLWKASKGVTVAGLAVVVEKLVEAVDAGEIGRQQGRLLIGDTCLEAYGHGGELVSPSTRRLSRQLRRELGLVLADGVLQEVEVDVAEVLEAALDTDLWERRG